ncbi:hypothetical protein C2S52_017182 [Perilla frutescens var. hirtella]|uniref:Uncharacterized protein n=1 Tax=Perilla frutescens var. hirtella TaxID=608512 RepID=A0AAD4IV18_PERFH|nr:hypothetical protein C2S52_017182 [Perilla frutescens var. hirtella]KAH6810982.1 hypothetical protein C2S51_024744 [Perilla frutescens var. frutescens]KAH6822014.1 hypothetical protein C2S53_014484 [Perilla frutescens var. hirtella]
MMVADTWMVFLRRPLAIVAALMATLGIAFLNDSFAGTFNEKVTRTVRHVSPHLAAKMRPHLTSNFSLNLCLLATLIHASFRTPNLKTRLNTFHEEFRAVWFHV